VRVGSTLLDLAYHNVGEDITLEVQRRGSGNVQLAFSPALSLHAKVLAADANGARVTPKISANENDQHATISVPVSADKTTIHLRVSGNFGIAYPFVAPADGAVSTNIKVVSEQWNAAHDRWQIQVAGVSGKTYQLPVSNAPSGIGVQGARFIKSPSGLALEVAFPAGDSAAPQSFRVQTITLQFPAP
jgi:hypothetical protein